MSASVFEQQIAFLKNNFRIVSPAEVMDRRRAHEKIRVMLTFDDGFRNHAEVVVPILTKYRVPAVFFISSRHSAPGKYLWFTYLQALEHHFPDEKLYFRKALLDMSVGRRQHTIQQLKNYLLALEPHPAAMYQAIDSELPSLEEFVNSELLADRYAGMKPEQVNALARNTSFSIGVHTSDHPFLGKCKREEIRWQIIENKRWLEEVSGRRCESIAYPSGDYNAEVLGECLNLGLSYGYALNPRLGIDPRHEIPRVGIYSELLDILGFKVQWGNLMRRLGLNFG